MIKHKLFSKGEWCHALISTKQEPNVLIPVRAMIYDVKFDDINPKYQIKIKKFYDSIDFLKKHLFGGRFDKDFEGKQTRINIQRSGYSKVSQLEDNVFNGDKWQQYLIVVDSVFCVKTKPEQQALFNKIHEFQIETGIKELFELTNRSTYNGGFKFNSKGEYQKALQKFLGDRYPKRKDWADEILYRPTQGDLDQAEWL